MGSSLSAETSSKLRLADKTHILNLSDEQFKTTADVWSKVQNVDRKLKTLDISGNNLKLGIPPEINVFINLKTLHLSRCDILSLPDLTHFQSIAHLKLDHNRLTEATISALPLSLVHLDLSYNLLRGIPIAVAVSANLTDLIISHNQITRLDGIESCVLLQDLNVDDNAILEVPEILRGLTQLRLLSLRNNELINTSERQCISSSIFRETNLQTLNLQGNSSLTNKIVSGLDGIESFMERRRLLKHKNLHGGGINDFSVFGLD